MKTLRDGPASGLFTPLQLSSGTGWELLKGGVLPEEMEKVLEDAPRGDCVGWGIPFDAFQVLLLKDQKVEITLSPLQTRWLVFMHTADIHHFQPNADGIVSPMPGEGALNKHAADYVFLYQDGSEERVQIRRRIQIGAFSGVWGTNSLGAVPAHKPYPVRAHHEQLIAGWGNSQTRVSPGRDHRWQNWLWAWENPHPNKALVGMRFEPVSGVVLVSAVSAGNTQETPLRWNTRQKALLKLPEGQTLQADLDADGLLAQIQLDLGQVISARGKRIYPNERWEEGYNNQLPQYTASEVVVEYTAHEEAVFHLAGDLKIPAAQVAEGKVTARLEPIRPAKQRVRLKVLDKASGKVVAVKLHVHGEAGEYLAPLDRNRFVNTAWFEDYSVDFAHETIHSATYIRGETVLDLPLGKVFVEISKGFEIRPIRKVVKITPETKEIVLEVEKVLPWREKGWVTADTHVHFLSPVSAMLEGAAEGVNVVNLLASQWGELMTNVGDFDGKTNWGSREVDGGPEGNGEYIVRMGTENRQGVMGHISLLGYQGNVISPMTTGGADESAIGDPIGNLLSDWARQCKTQGGVVVLPHFPYPRAEHAAGIVMGDIDAVEMTSWGDHYSGIDPYSLSDWYRYLNCGYMVAAVGGTDKMEATTAVGTVRTYARMAPDGLFSYDGWMEAVRRGETFVTYGPLLEFSVDGKPAGSRIAMSNTGGTVSVDWQVASVTVPMSRVDLVVNGEVRESVAVDAWVASGSWKLKVDKSSWIALLVRGHQVGRPEVIAAHSSAVLVEVKGSELMAAADALTILEQIEGTIGFLDSVGIRAEDREYKRMRMILTSAHREIHNRMHRAGSYHEHNVTMQHPDGHSA